MQQDVPPVGSQPELSGIVKSQRYQDVWWVHNDSGNPPALYPVDAEGRLVALFRGAREPGHGIEILNASNVDWEDIALTDGWLYVADLGNNGNARRDLGIYVVAEPNPQAIEKTRALAYIPIVYPEQQQFPAAQWHFDADALFTDGHALFVITKHRSRRDKLTRGAHVYMLDLSTISPLLPNPLQRVDTHPSIGAATAADLSPDGRWLAVLAVQRLWFFIRPEDGMRWLTGAPGFAFSVPLPTNIGQAEAVSWDDNQSLRIVTENDAKLVTVKLALPLP